MRTGVERPYDSVLMVAFGGPEGREDVVPFLENVLRGRNVPRDRLLEVAAHYQHFDGVSPINAQNRALSAALQDELERSGLPLRVFLGNRNWHPFLAETLREMAGRGGKRALAFFTSPYSSYSSCRQYREDIERARQEVGPQAPEVDKLRGYYNHPGFIRAQADRLRAVLDRIAEPRREGVRVAFTAHSIPQSMAAQCRYEVQFREASGLVAQRAGCDDWDLAYQSRSGQPGQPWLEPDIRDHLSVLKARGAKDVVVCPIGFLSDHMEVLYDLDVEARQVAQELGLNLVRAATVGTHPLFVRMIRDLIVERLNPASPRPSWGRLGPSPDLCPSNCCPRPAA